MAAFTIKGKTFTTNGELPAVGGKAPDFCLTDSRLNDKTLANFKGKKKLLYIVASLDTDVCETTTRKFNEAFKPRDDAVLLLISADLPFAQSRYCGKGKLENIQALSGMRDRHFAKDYGVLIQDGPLAGLMARAVVVLDENNKVLYTQLVEEMTNDPDYEQALAALG
ncbi:MAG TPA: thiol peroxidase [Gammaproteobacteria bacterium]